MIYHQDCVNEEYCTNFYEKHLEIVILKIPDKEYKRGELFFNISIYFEIENTIVKYNDKTFTNKEDLKLFLKSFNQRKLSV